MLTSAYARRLMRVEPVRSTLTPPPADDRGEPRLLKEILAEIDERGPITFARFMERALYEPGLGYYATSRERTTRGGDFVTAPELHPIFGLTVARQIERMRELLGSPADFTVCEYGAGRGTLGAALPNGMTYVPLEFDSPPQAAPFTGVVLANELLDALPVHRVVQRAAGLRELKVGRSEGRLIEVETELSEPRLRDWFDRRQIRLVDGQRAEVNLAMLDWLTEIGRDLKRGYALLIDYGLPAAELYGADRATGTIRAFRGQHVSSDVLDAVGHQDITAHVDLDALEAGAQAAGFAVIERTRQAEFLLANGFEQVYAEARSTADEDWDAATQLRSAVTRLLDPRGMGGFGVVILGKDVANAL
jgi:SAM-dependent MidA family methyltransferase